MYTSHSYGPYLTAQMHSYNCDLQDSNYSLMGTSLLARKGSYIMDRIPETALNSSDSSECSVNYSSDTSVAQDILSNSVKDRHKMREIIGKNVGTGDPEDSDTIEVEAFSPLKMERPCELERQRIVNNSRLPRHLESPEKSHYRRFGRHNSHTSPNRESSSNSRSPISATRRRSRSPISATRCRSRSPISDNSGRSPQIKSCGSPSTPSSSRSVKESPLKSPMTEASYRSPIVITPPKNTINDGSRMLPTVPGNSHLSPEAVVDHRLSLDIDHTHRSQLLIDNRQRSPVLGQSHSSSVNENCHRSPIKISPRDVVSHRSPINNNTHILPVIDHSRRSPVTDSSCRSPVENNSLGLTVENSHRSQANDHARKSPLLENSNRSPADTNYQRYPYALDNRQKSPEVCDNTQRSSVSMDSYERSRILESNRTSVGFEHSMRPAAPNDAHLIDTLRRSPVQSQPPTHVSTQLPIQYQPSNIQHSTPLGSHGPQSYNSNQDRRYRTAFSKDQLTLLETEYGKESYVNRPKRCELAEKLSLPEATIKVWFQNRRMKEKRTRLPYHHLCADPTALSYLLHAARYVYPTSYAPFLAPPIPAAGYGSAAHGFSRYSPYGLPSPATPSLLPPYGRSLQESMSYPLHPQLPAYPLKDQIKMDEESSSKQIFRPYNFCAK